MRTTATQINKPMIERTNNKMNPTGPLGLIQEAGSVPIAKPIKDTLDERGARYGEFEHHARITQKIKQAMVDSPNWNKLPDDMKEAMEMVAHKFGRILNGDPYYMDSWHDAIGYLTLIERKY
jgi:hypothetical protein